MSIGTHTLPTLGRFTVCGVDLLAAMASPPQTCFGMDAQRALEQMVHSASNIHIKPRVGKLELDLVNDVHCLFSSRLEFALQSTPAI